MDVMDRRSGCCSDSAAVFTSTFVVQFVKFCDPRGLAVAWMHTDPVDLLRPCTPTLRGPAHEALAARQTRVDRARRRVARSRGELQVVGPRGEYPRSQRGVALAHDPAGPGCGPPVHTGRERSPHR